MNRKLDLSVVLLLLVTAILATVLLTRMYMGGALFQPADGSVSGTDKLAEALELIEENYIGPYDEQAVVDSAISGMVEALGDRWSYYMTAEELSSYLDSFYNQYTGIGIVIEGTDSGVLVTQVYADTPAAQAGIQPGDQIVSIGDADVRELGFTEVSAQIQEQLAASGQVRLGLQDTSGQTRTVDVVAEVIEVDPVSYELLDGGIGLISIDNFDTRCAEQMIAAVEALREQGATALIFDVRNNPGGQLSELLAALDYLLPEGTTFISKDRDGSTREETSDAACVDMPMAVLVNAESYSAAEFFAAALQEYNWATIVGEQTTGKGYAQITVGLRDGSAIHISSMEYFTPSGKSLANVGITPDVEVPLDDDKFVELYYGRLAHEQDDQLMEATKLFLTE